MCASRQRRSSIGGSGPVVRGVPQAETATATVLVVDDDPEIASLTGAYLKRLETDVTVLVRTSPSDAVALFGEVEADCVVSDYEMPKMDGLDVLEAVREHDPSVPVVIFTATDDAEVAEQVLEHGAEFARKERGGFDRLAEVVASELDGDDDGPRIGDGTGPVDGRGSAGIR